MSLPMLRSEQCAFWLLVREGASWTEAAVALWGIAGRRAGCGGGMLVG